MKTMSDRYSVTDEESLLWNLLRGTVGFLWFVIRVPIGIVLAFLEPFVRLALFGIAVAGITYCCGGEELDPFTPPPRIGEISPARRY